MTVTTTEPREQYAGDDLSTAFPFPHYFLADSDLVVYLVDEDGNPALKTLTTHFTVSGAGDESGGTVTFLTAPAVGETVVIIRNPVDDQQTNYENNDSFPAAAHERALDRRTMVSQRLNDRLNRTLRFHDADPVASDDLELPPLQARLGKFLRFNDTTGEPEMSDIVELGTPLSQSIIAGLLWPQSTVESGASVTPTDLTNPIRITPFRYGAVGDGVENDTAAVQAAIDVASAAGGTVDLAGGDFLVETLTFDASNFAIKGPGILRAHSSIPASGAILLSLAGGADTATNQALLDGIYGASVQSVRTSVTGSLENVRIDDVSFVGNSNAIRGIWATGFTRGCRINGHFDGFQGAGIVLNGSWSFSLVGVFCKGDGTNGTGIQLGVIGNGTRSGATVCNSVTILGLQINSHNVGLQWDFGSRGFVEGTIESCVALGMTSQAVNAVTLRVYFENNGATTDNNRGNLRLGGTNGTDFCIGWDISACQFAQSSTAGHNLILRGLQHCYIGKNRFGGTRTQWYLLTSGTSALRTDCDIEVADLSSTYISNFASECNAAYNEWRLPSGKKPINTQNSNYTFTIQDPARITYKASGGAGETWTIDSNANVPMPVGTELECVNNGGGDLTLAITDDTLVGSTTVATGTLFRLKKIAATTWIRG